MSKSHTKHKPLNKPLNRQDINSQYRISLWQLLKSLPSLLPRLPRATRARHGFDRSHEFESLGKLIEQTAERFPQQTFICFEGRKISYKEFNDNSNKMARYLEKQSIVKGEVVALLFENRPELLMCAVAVVKLGAIAALISPTQKGQVLLHSINLVKSKSIIVGEELIDAYQDITAESCVQESQHYYVADQDIHQDFKPCPAGFINLPKDAYPFSSKAPAQMNKVHRQDSCFYFFISGTTGMPKASISNHNRWVFTYAGIGHGVMQLTTRDVFYCPLPLCHATAMVVCLSSVVAGGSSLVLKRKFNADEFWGDIIDNKVTAFGYVGELCRYLLNQTESSKDKKHKVKTILGNGLRPANWEPFKKRFGIKRVVEFYASSEGNTWFINLFNLNNTIGFGSSNTTVVKYDKQNYSLIKDSLNHAQIANKGETGLLIGKIDKRTPFYGFTDKNLSRKAILTDVFKEGDQWFNTGDLVRHMGFRHYQFVDRITDSFHWKGENIFTTELENICLQNPKIKDCIAYGVEIPEIEGRAAMVSLKISPPEDSKAANSNLEEYLESEIKELFLYFKKNLPAGSLPVFIRIKKYLDRSETFKHNKLAAQEEAYDQTKVTDPIYVLLPSANHTYTRLNAVIYEKILNGFYEF